MVEPKVGKVIWRIRSDDDGKNPVFVGITKARIVSWDNDMIVADAGIGGYAALYFERWSSWFDDEQVASNIAHQLAKALTDGGKTVKIDPDLKPSTAVNPAIV